MKKSVYTLAAIVVLCAFSLTASAQGNASRYAMGGSIPPPQAPSNAMGGSIPPPQISVGGIVLLILSHFGF